MFFWFVCFFFPPSSACLPYFRTVFHFSQSHTLKFTNLDTVHLLRLPHHNFPAIWACLIQTALTCVFSPFSGFFSLLQSILAFFTHLSLFSHFLSKTTPIWYFLFLLPTAAHTCVLFRWKLLK